MAIKDWREFRPNMEQLRTFLVAHRFHICYLDANAGAHPVLSQHSGKSVLAVFFGDATQWLQPLERA